MMLALKILGVVVLLPILVAGVWAIHFFATWSK